MNRSVKLRVRELHAHVTCFLCEGYFIDATTIIECLHSFCRTCIVRYLDNRRCCPVCRVQVHKTRPLLNIRSDQTLQDIVYKLVPGLLGDEMKRRRRFWNDNPEQRKDFALWRELTPEELGDADQTDAAAFSCKITLVVEPVKRRIRKADEFRDWTEIDCNLSKRYLRTSQDLCVGHLHKFIRAKLNEPSSTEVLFLCGDNVLPRNYTLSDVRDTFSSPMDNNLHLCYCVFYPRSLKRKLQPVVPVKGKTEPDAKCRKVVAKKSTFKKQSATPQLKAFFIKNISPPSAEKPKLSLKCVTEWQRQDADERQREAKEKKLVEQVAARDTTAKLPLFEMLQLTTMHRAAQLKRAAIRKLAIQKREKERSTSISSLPDHKPTPQRKTETKVEYVKPKPPNAETNYAEKANSTPQKPECSSSFNSSQARPWNKQNSAKARPNKVKCYSVLTIPVDEAVRSKPPTPVVDPLRPSPVLKRGSNEPVQTSLPSKIKPFVQRTATNDVPVINADEVGSSKDRVQNRQLEQQQRNRRKTPNPVHHANTNSSNHQNPPSHITLQRFDTTRQQLPAAQTPTSATDTQSNFETIRIQSPNSGKFILLSTEAIKDRNPAQTIALQLPTPNQPPRSPVSSAPLVPSQPPMPELVRSASQSGQLQSRINAQAHRTALDAVRNTMGKVLFRADLPRQVQQKRLILPKNMSSPNTGLGNIPIRVPNSQTRNIFQNEQVIYPMNKPISSAPCSNTTRAPVRTSSQNSNANSLCIDELEQLKKLREHQDFLNKLTEAAAASNQLANRKKPTAVSETVAQLLQSQSNSNFRIKKQPSIQDSRERTNLQAQTSVVSSQTSNLIDLNQQRFNKMKPIPQRDFEKINSTSIRRRIVNEKQPTTHPRFPNNVGNIRPLPRPTDGSQNNKQMQFTRLVRGGTISAPRQPSAKSLLLQSRGQERGVVRPVRPENQRRPYNPSPMVPNTNNSRFHQQSRPPIYQHLSTPPAQRFFQRNPSPTQPPQLLQTRSRLATVPARHPVNTNSPIPIPRPIPSIIRRSLEKTNPQWRPGRPNQPPPERKSFPKPAHIRPRSASHEIPAPAPTPPAGTKSPWSTRGYPLPDIFPAYSTEFVSRSDANKPPPAHQQPTSTNFNFSRSSRENTSSPCDMQPLELTKKSSTCTVQPNNIVKNASDQPLCLVVKK